MPPGHGPASAATIATRTYAQVTRNNLPIPNYQQPSSTRHQPSSWFLSSTHVEPEMVTMAFKMRGEEVALIVGKKIMQCPHVNILKNLNVTLVTKWAINLNFVTVIPMFIHINGYNCVRRDRPNGKGGGLLVYVQESLDFIHLPDLQKAQIKAI